jgi:hypothetical protein
MSPEFLVIVCNESLSCQDGPRVPGARRVA